jgi:ABC-type multidrug transport system fused ATPase/permease subunit
VSTDAGAPRPGGERALLAWLWRGYLRARLPALLLAMALMAVEGGMLGALSWLVKPMFDEVFVAGSRAALAWVAGGVAAVFAIRALAAVGQRVLMARLGERVAAALQLDLLRHILRLDPPFFQSHPPGVLIERVRGDTQGILMLFTGVIAALGRDGVALVSLLAVALSIDWVWTLIAVIGAPILIGPIVALQRLVRRTARTARAAAAHATTRLDEIFHGIATVQLTHTEAREADRYRKAQGDYVRAQVRAAAGAAGIPALMDIVAAIGFAGVLTFGGAEIIAGEKTVGEFMAFFTAMALVFEPLRRLGAVSATLQTALAGLERARALFDAAPRITAPAAPKPALPPGTPARIVFEDVHFAHGATPVLHGVSFTAEPGRTTALVGPSGAGKTTVFALIARLADPSAGRITLGGTDLREMDPADLRAQLSVVSQEAALFDESIRDNILMGRAPDPAALAAAVAAAHVDEFAARLPRGLETPAGPRGSGLSGGQRQRVAIARALLRDTPVLLLDEATSALDAASEAAVQAALGRLAAGRTTLVIAHRLATIRAADRIVVLDRGRVVDQGSHDELIARGGLYAELCRLQFAEG